MAGKMLTLAAALGLAWAGDASAQTKGLETQAFTSGLSVSSAAAKRLESVVGEISGPKASGRSQKAVSGHSATSHSPGVLTDISVSTQSAGEGEAGLNWTHKGRDGNVGQAATYDFKVATYPLTGSNFASAASLLSVSALAPGATAWRLLTGPPPGPVYYLAGRARDGANLTGRVSPNTSFQTAAIAPDPVGSLSVQSASGGELNLSWNVTGDDSIYGDLGPGYFRIDWSTDAAHAFANTVYAAEVTTAAAAGSSQLYRLGGLLGNATYYATVYIGDDLAVFSGLSQIGQMLTQAYPPTLTGFSGISTGGFTASFGAGNTPGTEYLLEVSSRPDYLSAVSSGWTASASINFSGLQPRTTYYARGRARNAGGVQTAYAELGSVVLPQVSGTWKPAKAYAKGVNANGFFVISWGAVVSDAMGNPSNIARYDIYSSTAVGGAAQLAASVSSGTLSWSAAAGAQKWYYVQAVDEFNNAGDDLVWLSNQDGAGVSVSDDKAYVRLPKGVNDSLSEDRRAPVTNNLPEQETGSVLSAYRFYFVDGDNNVLLNADFPGDVSVVLPLSRNSAFLPQAVYTAYDYAVFYDNGVEEIKLGGTVDPGMGTITVITRKTGVFRVKQTLRAQSFRVTQTVPRKIFTPNGDGVWDEFGIIFENPAALPVTEARVYDVSGAEVARLKAGSYGADSLAWDGNGKDGDKAAAGIYIYQFKAGGKYYNGTVVLAR